MALSYLPRWQKISRIFDDRAAEYDAWFEEGFLFEIELEAVKAVSPASSAAPRLEIGVGTGRFAAALAVTFGVEPAAAPLALAARRGITAVRGIGEALPLRSGSFEVVFLLFVLSFLENPGVVFRECFRVLRPTGSLVLGMVNGSSPWGRLLLRKKEEGNPFYRYARFRAPQEVQRLLESAGFEVGATVSTLMQPPGAVEHLEKPRSGFKAGAGFVVMHAVRKEKRWTGSSR